MRRGSTTSGLLVLLLAAAGLLGCGGEDGGDDEATSGGMTLTSPAFTAGGAIPAKYAATGGDDTSPPLAWSGIPAGTRTLVLIVDDPDAAGFTHWVVYDIPPSAEGMPEGRPAVGTLSDPAGAKQGVNDGPGTPGWFGPEPPSGETHRYEFALYALDRTLDLEPGATKADVLERLEEHVLGATKLVATYGR